MPRGDKTGPEGLGRMIGRKMGRCVGNDTPGYTNTQGEAGRGFGRGNGGGLGRGYNRGRGFGMRFRNWFGWDTVEGNADISPKTSYENEIRILKDQVSALEKKLSERNS